MLNIGFSEAVVIFMVALIVLGPERLPEVGKYLAKLSIEVKKSIDEIKRELELDKVEEELKQAKEELEKIKQQTVSLAEKSLETQNDENKSS
ncbi:MAG: twin-arginine translocase subunit TatB [Thermodesulfobacteria bacterium]|nr:twin-arginine translocase subunit TatB [Thermodesulfobacteriota bacterium]